MKVHYSYTPIHHTLEHIANTNTYRRRLQFYHNQHRIYTLLSLLFYACVLFSLSLSLSPSLFSPKLMYLHTLTLSRPISAYISSRRRTIVNTFERSFFSSSNPKPILSPLCTV